MKKRVKVSSIIYDENLDILEVMSDATTHYCKNIEDLVIIHFNDKSKIVGLEFLDVSEIYGIPKKVLNNLKSARILINVKPEEKRIFITTKLISVINKKEITNNLLTTPNHSRPIKCL